MIKRNCQCCKKEIINIAFIVQGNIMAVDKKSFGGIVGGNIGEGKLEKWEGSRSIKTAESKDGTLRIYEMTFCKKCLINIIQSTK